MSKRSIILLLAAFFLIVCASGVGEAKKKVPKSTNAQQQQQAGPATQIQVRDIALDDIFVDANCRVWVRWKNRGNVKIDKVLRETVFVYGTGQQSDSANQVVLEPGAVFAHGVGSDPGMKLSGAATVTAIIDANNVLTEKNEDNNLLVKTLTCGKALPDLMPTYVSCHTLQNYVDAQNHGCKVFEVSVTIKNFGNRDVTTPFKVFLERDSGPNLSYVSLAIYDVPALAAGAQLVLQPKQQSDTCFWYISNPTLTFVNPRIRVTVDSGSAVTESLENNNQAVHSCNL